MTKRGEQVMRLFPSGEAHRRFLEALAATGLSLDELWLRYFALGGDAGKVEIEAYLDGMVPLSVLQHDLLARALRGGTARPGVRGQRHRIRPYRRHGGRCRRR